MRLYTIYLLSFLILANCQYNPENNGKYNENTTDHIEIIEKSPDDSIWKKYYVKFHGFKKDIPGEYIDSPYIIKYNNKFILACPQKRETSIFLIMQKNNKLTLNPINEENNYKLFMDKCRLMNYYPIRLVNGTILELKNGQLISDYSIECSSKENPDPTDIIYLEFRGIFDIDSNGNVLKLKNIEGPIS